MLRLKLLASDLVDAVLDGRQPDEMTLPALMKLFLVASAIIVLRVKHQR